MSDAKKQTGKLPPQNVDAEVSLLGAILLDEDVLIQVSDKLSAEDFYDPRHSMIYEAMLRLFGLHRPIDLLTLSDELKKHDELEKVGGSAYLTELTNMVLTSAHSGQYADIVNEKAVRRRLIKTAGEIAQLGFDEEEQVQMLLEQAEKRLFAVSDKGSNDDLIPLEQILSASFDRLDELHNDSSKLRGVATGYPDLDGKLAGFQRSDLIVLAARPSMGKSTLAVNFAHNIAVSEKLPVLIFSLEMSKEQLVDRMLADEAGVDSWKIRTGDLNDEDFEKLGQAMGVLSEAPIYIDDTPGISVLQLRTKARRQAHGQPLGLIIVDYLQLMSGGGRSYGDNRVQEVSEISRGLKLIARELNVPVIALSQLSRTVETRTPPHPQLADLRESGCLAGDTLIHLPEFGTYVPIKDLVDQPGIRVSSLCEENYKLEPGRVVSAFSTGIKPVYKLETRLGKTIRATANHKFLTIGGWKRLDQLEVGDRLAAPRVLSGPEQATISDAELALLGHLIGDGCTLPRHAIQYTTREEDLAEYVSGLATTVFKDTLRPRISRERQWYQVYLSASSHLTHGVHNPITTWLSGLGVYGLRSYEKFVPDAVFQQPNEQVGLFLRHIWATDGCILPSSTMSRYPTIYYASSSLKLAQNVQSLLLRLSIQACLSRHPQKGKGRDQYHVHVSGQDNIFNFIDRVGAVGKYKSEMLRLIARQLSERRGNPNSDIVPKEVWRMFAIPAMQKIHMTTRQLQTGLGNAYCGSTLYRSGLSRTRTALLANVVQSKTLQALSTSDIFWDKIASIEYDGEEEVFDLTIPRLHNFVANDITVHNSIEQDADVVMFIYREDMYNEETDRKHITDIFIRKHRNGPTGKIELYFHPERMRFLSVDNKHKS